MTKAYKEPTIRHCRECRKLLDPIKDKGKIYCCKECGKEFMRKYTNSMNQEFGKLNDKMYNNLSDKEKDDYLEECRKKIMNEI